MVDELEDTESVSLSDRGTREDDNAQVLGRLRPDGWAISWGRRQVLLLELTRAYDGRQDWHLTTDNLKVQRYAQVQAQMQRLLPSGWTVETVPLTVGVRGSLHEPAWHRILDRFGIRAGDEQTRFLQGLIRQVLEELDGMYGVRSAALRNASYARNR